MLCKVLGMLGNVFDRPQHAWWYTTPLASQLIRQQVGGFSSMWDSQDLAKRHAEEAEDVAKHAYDVAKHAEEAEDVAKQAYTSQVPTVIYQERQIKYSKYFVDHIKYSLMLCPFPHSIEYIVLNVIVIVIRIGIEVAYLFFSFLLCFQIWYLVFGPWYQICQHPKKMLDQQQERKKTQYSHTNRNGKKNSIMFSLRFSIQIT